jgi:hypothetical protein
MNGGQPIDILSGSLKCWGSDNGQPPDILYLSEVRHKAARQRRSVVLAAGIWFQRKRDGFMRDIRGISERIAAAVAKTAFRKRARQSL